MPQGAPPRIEPKGLADYFEVMTRAVFQSGISWAVIDNKWDGFRAAFAGFDPERVAQLSPKDIDRLVEDTSIVRNRRKIEATVENAETMVALDREHGGFRNYLRSLGGFDATAEDLKKRFRFLGETGCYYFLYVVGEEVPAHDAWSRSRGLDPRTGRPPKRSRARSR
jgi:3-methyladenine DNA glycosylase Tag